MSTTYAVSTDRQQRMSGKYCGQSFVVDERGQYVTDAEGEVLTFPTAHDAEQWIERRWMKSVGIQPTEAK